MRGVAGIGLLICGSHYEYAKVMDVLFRCLDEGLVSWYKSSNRDIEVGNRMNVVSCVSQWHCCKGMARIHGEHGYQQTNYPILAYSPVHSRFCDARAPRWGLNA